MLSFTVAVLSKPIVKNYGILRLHNLNLIKCNCSKTPSYLRKLVDALKDVTSREESNTSPEAAKGFFCVENTISSKDVKVSVNGGAPLSFPIKNDVIEGMIAISEKAKFGKGSETVLDTSYRDTQMIPADKLKVEIDQQILDKLLRQIADKLKIQELSELKIHLYNMLIYKQGQFFKRHQDTEKVPNMIATLIMVLPALHKGGDLIIEHHDFRHRFFGSLNHEIIKCVTFYSDCYHEVTEVDEGYRVALTYNVELKSGESTDVTTVDENLKNAVNEYFNQSGEDMLVYFLNHEYTERSLRWYMLKGADQICGKALLAVGKEEGYSCYLALADYHEQFVEEYRYKEDKGDDLDHYYNYDLGDDDEYRKDIDTKLYFWIDENNIYIEPMNKNSWNVSEDQLCFMMGKNMFEPYKVEADGYLGNEPGTVNQWYHRSAVVLRKKL